MIGAIASNWSIGSHGKENTFPSGLLEKIISIHEICLLIITHGLLNMVFVVLTMLSMQVYIQLCNNTFYNQIYSSSSKIFLNKFYRK